MKQIDFLKLACSMLVAFGLGSCADSISIEGNWVEPIPGMEDQMQGICLGEGGKASSINMATLQYEKWEKDGDKLILTGKSIGNGLESTFSDTLTIKECTTDKLVLKKGELTINYQKQK